MAAKTWLKSNKDIWELAIECKDFLAENPQCTFGDMADSFGVYLENVCTAVTRHWEYDWRKCDYTTPIVLINPHEE